MRTFLTFAALMMLSALLIVLGVILGDHASWYFAWIVGTAMIVLVSAAAMMWLDAQEAERHGRPQESGGGGHAGGGGA